MTTKGGRPARVVDAGDAHEVARVAAQRVANVLCDAIALRGAANMALSGGNTPREAYALLARAGEVDWGRTSIFWVDERAVPPTDDRSNYRWAKEALLDVAPIPSERVYRMRADDADLGAAARAYEKRIRDNVAPDGEGVPSFDVAIMGIGDDGHTASLFPGDSAVTITDRLAVAVSSAGNREARITLTAPVIQHVRHVLFLAVGQAKRDALERAWADDGDVGQTPARLVRQACGEVEWIVDDAAAAGLRRPG